MSGWIVLIVLGSIALLALVYVVGIFNRLVTLRNRFQNARRDRDRWMERRTAKNQGRKRASTAG